MKWRVALISNQPATRSAVAAALPANGRIEAPSMANSVEDLERFFPKRAPDLIIVDLDPHPRRELASVEAAMSRYAGAWIVAVSESCDITLLREAMQAGVRQWITRSELAVELRGVLERLDRQRAAAAPALGTVITLFSSGGGCGATTIAVNLARELELETHRRVLLVDMDLTYGGAAAYLGVEGRFGVIDVLEKDGPIDRELIETTSMSTAAGMSLLLSPASTSRGTAGDLRTDRLDELLEVCRTAYDYTILDAPRLPTPVMLGLAQASQLVAIVLQANVRELRFARTLISQLSREGVDEAHMLALLNRAGGRRQMIAPSEIDRVLGPIARHHIRGDFKLASRSADLGKPLSETAPRSRLRKDFMRLTRSLI